MNSLNAAGLYLISTLFDLYLIVMSVRLILAWERASSVNPVTNFIVKITQPVIGPLRRIIPPIGKLELATLVFILFFEAIKFLVISALFMGVPSAVLLIILSIEATIKLILNTFFFAIILFAILSWIHTGPSPIAYVLQQLSEPILRPLRRVIPLVSGFDITPIPALIILQLLIILL